MFSSEYFLNHSVIADTTVHTGPNLRRNVLNSLLRVTELFLLRHLEKAQYGTSKVHPRTGHESPEREQIHSSTLPSTSALDGVGGQLHAPVALPPGSTRYPFYKRLVWPQGRCGRERKISPPNETRSPDRLTVANRYTDWVSRPPVWNQALSNSQGQSPCEADVYSC